MLCTCFLSFQVKTYLNEDSATARENSDIDVEYAPTTSAESHFPTKQKLDDLIRDLGLTKSGAELLTSRLNEWNLLSDDCKSTAYRKSHSEFSVYFDVIENLCYCKDVEGLFRAVGNVYPSIPLAYSLQMKEDYENVKQLLIKINYAQFKWYVCGDFKMLGFLLCLQGEYTKYFCFLCL